MANTKITALSELTSIAEDDYFPVVDTSETATKKISFSNIHKSTTLDNIMQSDNTDQAIVSTTASQLITFDTDVSRHGIDRTSSSRFTISTPGTYLITFSGLVVGINGKAICMWLRSGTHAGASTVSDNVADSNTYYTFKSTGGTGIIAVAFLQNFVSTQWFEFLSWGDDTSNKWDYTAAVADNPGVTPGRPACPSIIFTANRI